MHYQFVDNKRSQSLVKFQHSEIEVYDIRDLLKEIIGFIKRSVQIFHHLFHLWSKDVPEQFLLCAEIIMDQSLIATYRLSNLCSRSIAEAFLKKKAFSDP